MADVEKPALARQAKTPRLPPGGLILTEACRPRSEDRTDRVAQGPLDLSRFETPDMEDKIPA